MSRATANTQAYRARKRAAGICIAGGCWEAARTGLTLCAVHGQAHRRDPVCVEPGCGAQTLLKHRLCARHAKERHKAGHSRWRRAERQRRIAAGLCETNGCAAPPVAPGLRCAEHAAQYAERARSYFQRKRAAGLCLYGGCQVPHAPGRSMCAEHAGRNNAQWREWTRSQGARA